jgi:RHS repeat-associated protein
MSYDHANRVTRVTNPATGETVGRYHYDDQGFRVRTIALDDDGVDRKETMLLYASMYFGVEIQKDVYTGDEIYNVLNNIYLNGVRVAAMVPTGEAAHFHTDQVDSVKVVTNDAGAVVSRMEYLPYGETWFQEGDDRFAPKYNSQELDRESGYYFYNARHYDPQMCRFVTADNRIPDDMNTQGWNRFAYVINNPILYLDPTGHEWYQKREQEELDTGRYLQVDFKVNGGNGRYSSQRWYTDNPAEDMKTVTGNDISRAKWKIGEKSANITKWTNPAEKFQRPTTISDPKITSGYLPNRVDPVDGRTTSSHLALDIASESSKVVGNKSINNIDGTNLKPLGAGRVTFVDKVDDSQAGRQIEISYGNGRISRYMHTKDINVKEGQWINIDKSVGTVGNTGHGTGPHLHFEVKKVNNSQERVGESIWDKGSPINPNRILQNPY